MPITPPPPPLSNLRMFRSFWEIFLSLCLVLAVVGSMHYYTVYTTERSAREASESLNVDLARHMIITDIEGVVSDLMFLAEHIEGQGLLDDLTYNDEQRIVDEFTVFADKKKHYDQIRYLDSSGMEIVRINFNGGQPQAVIQRELQNKASRYYFREAMALERDGIYLSPLDLNIEEGEIEYPLKPMMRFGTPVFDQAGQKKGIILLNYFGDHLIENFTRAGANIADHIELVNSDGFWLRSPKSKDEWGFMLGTNKTFQQRSNRAWQYINRQESGQFEMFGGMFTFAAVNPKAIAQNAANPAGYHLNTSSGGEGGWKIVSRVSPRELSATLPFFLRQHFSLYLAMLFMLAIGAWFIAQAHHRNQAAEAQRDYEQRFRHTLENIELAAIALDRRGKVTFCNDYFLSLTGWRRHEVEGTSWIEQFVTEDLEKEVTNIIDGMSIPEHFPSHYEIHVKTKDGGLRLIAWNNTLSYDAAGQVIGVTGIGEDITEQRAAEESLRKLNRAVEQSPSVVLITNIEGLIEYANPKFTEVSGYTLEEVKGKSPSLLKSGETSSTEYSNLWSTVSTGGEWRGEFHNRKKTGELYWESASISGIRNSDGEITHFLAVKEDITEQKRLEMEVEARNKELARAQALAAMGKMASMIAHDLRNPLSSVKMTLQILGKQTGIESNAEIDELRSIALEQIRYMEDILSDMLTYSKPDALKPDWITIDRVINLAINISQRRIDESGIELRVNYHSGLPTLLGDPTKLRQVFSNLISNAVQASERVHKPCIEIDAMVELSADGTGIRIEICDNGGGIEEEARERIFEPFFTTRSKGTGLGLAIVKRILEQHQGSIKMEPYAPQGTCATIFLPVSPQTETDSDTQELELKEV
ncbi:MAG: PAS domain S-box protein [Candidatus Sedimenticola sp. (ex Thyasira tokunagai)]